jgi:hypothetical protein
MPIMDGYEMSVEIKKLVKEQAYANVIIVSITSYQG